MCVSVMVILHIPGCVYLSKSFDRSFLLSNMKHYQCLNQLYLPALENDRHIVRLYFYLTSVSTVLITNEQSLILSFSLISLPDPGAHFLSDTVGCL